MHRTHADERPVHLEIGVPLDYRDVTKALKELVMSMKSTDERQDGRRNKNDGKTTMCSGSEAGHYSLPVWD